MFQCVPGSPNVSHVSYLVLLVVVLHFELQCAFTILAFSMVCHDWFVLLGIHYVHNRICSGGVFWTFVLRRVSRSEKTGLQ